MSLTTFTKHKARDPEFKSFVEEIKSHLSMYGLSSESNLICALAYGDKYTKIHFKAKAIWRGVIVRNVFESYNILAAVVIMDAFLRKHGHRIMIAEPTNLSVDLYCLYAGKKGEVSKQLEDVMKIVKWEDDGDAWGFMTENIMFCDGIRRFCENGKATYDVE